MELDPLSILDTGFFYLYSWLKFFKEKLVLLMLSVFYFMSFCVCLCYFFYLTFLSFTLLSFLPGSLNCLLDLYF